jgi:hypothetical protein
MANLIFSEKEIEYLNAGTIDPGGISKGTIDANQRIGEVKTLLE